MDSRHAAVSSIRPSARRRISLQAEPLEHRTLLSGSSVGLQAVAIQVPSAYVSQQADQLDVTLVRSGAGGHSRDLGPVTVGFSATRGSLPAGTNSVDDIAGSNSPPSTSLSPSRPDDD